MQTNCTVLAKVVVNKRLQTYRIIFTFDAHNKITVRNAALVTGDICSTDYVYAQEELTKALQNGMQQLRCANVALVD
jgi:hypothetical protein